MRFRKVLLQLHLWPSLILAALFLVTTVTGVALVFRPEIDAALNPHLFRPTPGDVGYERAYRAARAAVPDRSVVSMRSPSEAHGVYQVEFDGAPQLHAFVDPGTGSVLGTRDPDRALMRQILWLHLNLLSGDIGRFIVGLEGVLMLFVLVTGWYLWWPGLKRWMRGFRVRLRKGTFILNYDLHNLVGITSSPLLVVLALTGVMLIFYNVSGAIVYALFPGSAEESALEQQYQSGAATDPSGAPMGSQLSLDDFVRLGAAVLPGAEPAGLLLPAESRDYVMLWFRSEGDPRPNTGSSRIWLDRHTGDVLAVYDYTRASPAERINSTWLVALHFGSFGVSVRVLYLILGSAPVVLLVTGTTVWWVKRVQKRKGAERRRERLRGFKGSASPGSEARPSPAAGTGRAGPGRFRPPVEASRFRGHRIRETKVELLGQTLALCPTVTFSRCDSSYHSRRQRPRMVPQEERMKIKLTRVYVDDQEKALRFYTEVLGFVKKADFSKGSFRWLTVASPEEPEGTELQLALNDDPAAKAYQQAMLQQSQPAAMFYTDDVQGDYERMKERGAEFTMPPTNVTGSKIAMLNDTCGNLIQLTQLVRW